MNVAVLDFVKMMYYPDKIVKRSRVETLRWHGYIVQFYHIKINKKRCVEAASKRNNNDNVI